MAYPPTAQWAPSDDLLVTHTAAVQILWHPNKRKHLTPFLESSVDLAGASAALGITKSAMSYWIHRLLEAGLIRVDRVEKRGRHRVAFYRCVARRLRVGLSDAPLATYEQVFDDFSERWGARARATLGSALARQARDLELSFTASPSGGAAATILPRGGAEPPPDDFIFYWARLWLTEGEHERLAGELNALYDRYAALSDQHGKPVSVLMHLIEVRESR